MPHVEIRHVTLADQSADRYQRFAFDVPRGTTSLEVSLEVAGGDGAIVDLGCEGPDQWRGWSGGARQWFVIADDDATPGYLSGPITHGTWHVIAGLHTLPADGASLTVTVEIPAHRTPDHGPIETPAKHGSKGSERDLPAPVGLRWYAGDTHAHSLHSDGALSLWELANEGVRSGLDFLCVTDHNTTSHHPHLPSVGDRHGITLVPGQEVTTHAGHANAYGDIGFIDFRRPANEWAQRVNERGGLFSINHPVAGDCSWLHPIDRGVDAVELYHSSWYEDPIDTSALAWLQGRGDNVVLLGGGDFHNRTQPLRPGLPTSWVAAEECTPEAILDAMRHGRTTITASAQLISEAEARPIHNRAPILIRDREELTVLCATGLVLTSGSGRRMVVTSDTQRLTAPRDDGPYRLEDAKRQVLALSA